MGPGNRPLDLDWLEEFMVLADCGNFSRAAEACAVAQPALSRHIRALEAWVGADLVDRRSHPTELTPAGRKFQALMADVLPALEDARVQARAAQIDADASLSFAVTHVLSMTFFPHWLTALEAEDTLGSIHIQSDNLQACEDLMARRRVQFMLCHAHAGVPNKADELGLPYHVLASDTLVPVATPQGDGTGHPPAADPRFLADLPLLGYSEASALGRILRSRLPVKRDVSEVFTAHHAMLLKTLVLQGRGMAWLPQSQVRGELEDGRLHLAGGSDWHLPIDIRLYRQPSDMTPAAERLWQRLPQAHARPGPPPLP